MGSHNQQSYVEIYVHWGGLGPGVNAWGVLFELDYELYIIHLQSVIRKKCDNKFFSILQPYILIMNLKV